MQDVSYLRPDMSKYVSMVTLNYYIREDCYSTTLCCMCLQVTVLHLTVVKTSQPRIRIHLQISVTRTTEAAGG